MWVAVVQNGNEKDKVGGAHTGGNQASFKSSTYDTYHHQQDQLVGRGYSKPASPYNVAAASPSIALLGWAPPHFLGPVCRVCVCMSALCCIIEILCCVVVLLFVWFVVVVGAQRDS